MINQNFNEIISSNFDEIVRNFKAGLRNKGYNYYEDLMNDADLLINFIFNDKSFIVTGNDNCDEIDYDWMQEKINRANTYAHRIYYKGN